LATVIAKEVNRYMNKWLRRLGIQPMYAAEGAGTGAAKPESKLEEEELEEEDDLDLEDEGEEEDEDEENSVPLAVVLREKAKRKELERKLKEYEEKEHEKTVLAEKNEIKARYVKTGYSEALAEILAEERVQTNAELKRLKEDLNDREFKSELKDISKDKFFADIEDFAADIKAKMKEVKGLSIEEAYLLVNRKSATKRKIKELQTEDEQLAALERRNQLATQPLSKGGNSAAKSKLDKDDLKALKQLQQMQPDAGWTPKRYYEVMKKT
jgi:hypothetical protein